MADISGAKQWMESAWDTGGPAQNQKLADRQTPQMLGAMGL